MRNQPGSNRAAAQTASIGNQDMMTFMPSQTSAVEGAPVIGDGADAAAVPSPPAVDMHHPADVDPLRTTPFGVDRGESMDDEAFNASLDALLKEAYVDVGESSQHSLSGIMAPPPLPQPASAPAMAMSPPPLPASSTTAAGGRKRKTPTGTTPIVAGAHSMPPPEPVPAAAAIQQQQQQQQPNMANQPQHLPAPVQAPLNLNFSARGIVQLPPMFASHPISVGTNNAPLPPAGPVAVAATGGAFCSQPISVATGSGGNALSLQGTDYFAGSASPATAVAAPLPARPPQPAPAQQPRMPFQVGALGVSQHPSQHGRSGMPAPLQRLGENGNGAGDLSSSAASLMSQIALQPPPSQQQARPQAQVRPPPQAPPPQQQQQMQAQAGQRGGELFPTFQLNATPFQPWNQADAATKTTAAESLPRATAAGNPQAVSTAPATSAMPRASLVPPAAAVQSMPGGAAAASPRNALPTPPLAAAAARPPKRRRSPPPPATQTGTAAAFPPKPAAAPAPLAAPGVSEDESERQKRRSERNLREQERSHRITERIAELRGVLSAAGVAFKPDRYSTLVSVVEYIKQLQGKSVKLDEEHSRLLDTISGADRLVKGRGIAGGVAGGIGKIGSKGDATTSVHQIHLPIDATSFKSSSSGSHSNTDEEFATFVRGIDYKSIFARCGVALAITSVDGRFVDCNEEFLRITNYSCVELLGVDYGGVRRKSMLPHAQKSGDSSMGPPSGGRCKIVTVSTSNSATSSAPTAAARAVPATKTPDLHTSNGGNGSVVAADRPPPEITMRKRHHLSLFNLLGGEDMEAVYAAMSRMLRAPEPPAPTQAMSPPSRFMLRDQPHSISSGVSGGKGPTATDDSGGTSSSDSCVKSDLTRSTEETSSSGGEMMGGVGDMEGAISGGDHWTGRVKHTRRKDHMLQLNISLVRTMDGRPKFFNCALSEVE